MAERRLSSGLQRSSATSLKQSPHQTTLSIASGRYFLWVELAPGLDALALQRMAMSQNISIAPGQLFSADQRFSHHIRLNFGHPLAGQLEPALKTLGRLVHALAP